MAKPTASANEVSDGVIRFTVKGMDGTTRQIVVDCLLLKLCCEEAETANGQAGDKPPSAAFLKDLSQRLESLGVEACSPSIAYQLWHLAGVKIAELKKNISETPNSLSGSTSSRTGKGQRAKSAKGKK